MKKTITMKELLVASVALVVASVMDANAMRDSRRNSTQSGQNVNNKNGRELQEGVYWKKNGQRVSNASPVNSRSSHASSQYIGSSVQPLSVASPLYPASVHSISSWTPIEYAQQRGSRSHSASHLSNSGSTYEPHEKNIGFHPLKNSGNLESTIDDHVLDQVIDLFADPKSPEFLSGLQSLIDNNPSLKVASFDDESTVLSYVAEVCDLDVVKAIIAEVDPRMINSNALAFAINGENYPVIEYLKENYPKLITQVDPKLIAQADPKNPHPTDRNALERSLILKNNHVTKYLAEKHPDLITKTAIILSFEDLELLEVLVKNSSEQVLCELDRSGFTLLVNEINKANTRSVDNRAKSINIIRIIAKYGNAAQLSAKDRNGLTPIVLAMKLNIPDAVEAILENDDEEHLCVRNGDDHRTPLMIAIDGSLDNTRKFAKAIANKGGKQLSEIEYAYTEDCNPLVMEFERSSLHREKKLDIDLVNTIIEKSTKEQLLGEGGPYGKNALMLACIYGVTTDIINKIIEKSPRTLFETQLDQIIARDDKSEFHLAIVTKDGRIIDKYGREIPGAIVSNDGRVFKGADEISGEKVTKDGRIIDKYGREIPGAIIVSNDGRALRGTGEINGAIRKMDERLALDYAFSSFSPGNIKAIVARGDRNLLNKAIELSRRERKDELLRYLEDLKNSDPSRYGS